MFLVVLKLYQNWRFYAVFLFTKPVKSRAHSIFLCGKFELNAIFLLYCMKLSHINHDEKIYTAVFLNFILRLRQLETNETQQ